MIRLPFKSIASVCSKYSSNFPLKNHTAICQDNCVLVNRKYADFYKNVRYEFLDDTDTRRLKCHHGSPARMGGRWSDKCSSGLRLFYRSVGSPGS